MARILSIEDDADLQKLIGVALHAQGYDVHYAFNGKEGYDKILALNPDVVILDLMLPQMNGVDIIKAAQAHPEARQIPILVMTAYGDESNVLENSVKATGAVEFLRKPFEMRDFLRLVKSCLARNTKPQSPREELKRGVVRLDTQMRTVWVNDKLIGTLTDKRFELLSLLLQSEGGVKKEKLLKEMGGASGKPAALEKTVQRLREDLGPEAGRLRTTADGYEFLTRADIP